MNLTTFLAKPHGPRHAQSSTPSPSRPEPASQTEFARSLREELLHAPDWQGLSQVLEEVDRAYQRGAVTVEEAEDLARLAGERSRELPESVTDELPSPAPGAQTLRLSEFAASGRVQKVRSKALGEDVLWVADNAEVPVDNQLVVYRVEELRQLVGVPPDQLRRIHATKKLMDGEVIAPLKEEVRIPSEELYYPNK